MSSAPGIVIAQERIEPAELRRLVNLYFKDMVKFVVDLQRHVVAVGGELHADAEALLLEHGSRQGDLWGGNYLPGRGPDSCIEFASLINIRPAENNRSMMVEDSMTRQEIRTIVFELIGQGEPLA
jgi:hypothetical protein